MQYLALIHKNTTSESRPQEWEDFIDKALATKMFKGGSAIAHPLVLGSEDLEQTESALGGYMRFDTDDLEGLCALLDEHPVIKHGGSIELYEMPPTQ